MKKYNKIFILISLLATLLIAFPTNNVVILAASDESDALKAAPEGLNVGSYFSINDPIRPSVADFNYPYMTNSAFVDSNNENIVVLSQGDKNSESTTLDKGVYGAAWSDMNKDNYIDISKKQKVSVWLYFGAGGNKDKTTNGEGMALVLHNDPRKNGNNQSQALGAAYDALGVLGYDRALVPYTNYTWGLTTSYDAGQLSPSSYTAGTAIQNSISLGFDTELNDTWLGQGMNISTNGPLKYFTSSPSYNLIGTGSGYTEYSLQGFDTVDTLDPFGRKISSDYPGYDDLINQRPLTKYSLRQGNSGGQGFGVISMTYPGNPLTYGPGALRMSNGAYKYFNKNGKATVAVQAYAQSANLINGSDNANNPIYWHHVTFNWNPATDASGQPTSDGMPVSGGKPASIDYKFNDILPNGSINIGNNRFYSEISDSIPVDPTQFKLTNGDTKVYWGLTGANSTNENVYSKMAIFESIPALATVNVTSNIVDNDMLDSSGNKSIITNDDSTTTVPNRTVENNDKLTFNYNLNYESDSSRKNWDDIVSKIHLPIKDVNFTDPGTITYHTNAGQSNDQTEIESIPLDWQLDDENNLNELQHNLAHSLGTHLDSVNNPNNFTSADISFNGVAINSTSSPITVNPETAKFTGSTAIASSSSPKFLINNDAGINKQLELKTSDQLEFNDINYKTTQEFIQRKSQFELDVISLESPWILQVSTKGLFLNSNGQKFNGNLIYKKDENSNIQTLDENLQQIASDSNSYPSSTTTQIAKDWKNNTGILLQPNSSTNQSGKYSGKLTWNLIDAPGSEIS